MIKIARMQSGEDVIADVKEIRESPDSKQALGYEFADAFTAMIQRPTDSMFLTEETQEDSLEQLKDMKLEFFPWAPLASGRNIVSLFSVVSMSDPHENVLAGYEQVLEQYKNVQKPKDNAETDYSQTPPADLLIGESDGAG